jgi:DNA-binding CsgD family transcriptional regulator
MDAASPQLPHLATLTAREQEVLHWVAEGKSNGDIGRIIGCTEQTVKKHLQHIFPKLGVETRTAAARTYLQESALAAGPTAPGISRTNSCPDPAQRQTSPTPVRMETQAP